MSNASDFIIENGVLIKYVGPGGDVVIPDGVTEIGESAFFLHWRITSVLIPAEVTTIGKGAFRACESLASIILPSGLKEICCGAFAGCENLSSITIPHSVIIIGSDVFRDCKELQSIDIHGNITQIEERTFLRCEKLKSIVLPDSVISIGESAFLGCRSLGFMTFPKSVKKIGPKILNDCPSLEKISFQRDPKPFEGSDLNEIWSTLLASDAKLCLLISTLREYLHWAKSSELLSKKIKRNRQLILSYAFEHNDPTVVGALFSLYEQAIDVEPLNAWIDASTSAPLVSAFLIDYKEKNYSQKHLDEFETNQIEKEFGLRELTETDWKKIYRFEKSNNELTIKSYIGGDTDILVPEFVGKNKVVAIADDAFSPKVKRITEDVKINRQKIRSVVIPKSIKRIGANTFSGCTELEELSILCPSVNIGELPICNCHKLNKITFASQNYTFVNGLLLDKRKKAVLCYVGYVQSVIIPEGIEKICKYAFANSALSTIGFPKSLKSIGWGAFEDSVNLEHITLPEELTAIDMFAFCGCTNLKRVDLHINFKRFNSGIFQDCKKLTIYAPAGSYAEEYAKKNKIPFVAEG